MHISVFVASGSGYLVSVLVRAGAHRIRVLVLGVVHHESVPQYPVTLGFAPLLMRALTRGTLPKRAALCRAGKKVETRSSP